MSAGASDSGPSDRFVCCFCGGDTDDPEDYVELAVHGPRGTDGGPQWFGAHISCFRDGTKYGSSLFYESPVARIAIRATGDDGSTVTRLVRARRESGESWTIVDPEPEEERWEYATGQRVRCREMNGRLHAVGLDL